MLNQLNYIYRKLTEEEIGWIHCPSAAIKIAHVWLQQSRCMLGRPMPLMGMLILGLLFYFMAWFLVTSAMADLTKSNAASSRWELENPLVAACHALDESDLLGWAVVFAWGAVNTGVVVDPNMFKMSSVLVVVALVCSAAAAAVFCPPKKAFAVAWVSFSMERNGSVMFCSCMGGGWLENISRGGLDCGDGSVQSPNGSLVVLCTCPDVLDTDGLTRPATGLLGTACSFCC